MSQLLRTVNLLFGRLNLEEKADVEVTSEAEGYPIESAFTFGAGPGWRAASPGTQRIRLV